MNREGMLVLEDGYTVEGRVFGFPKAASGEVVFNTGMVGYPEALTDPSYKGQLLVLTYPLIGNYGVSDGQVAGTLDGSFESEGLQISGLIVSEFSEEHSHWRAATGFKNWLTDGGIPALSGIDTRLLTRRLRHQGTMLAKIDFGDCGTEINDPNKTNLVAKVSTRQRVVYE